MLNLLSIITFLPAAAALIGAVFLHGEDETAQRNAKWLALVATGATFLISLIMLFAVAITIDPVWTAAALIGARKRAARLIGELRLLFTRHRKSRERRQSSVRPLDKKRLCCCAIKRCKCEFVLCRH